MKAPAVQASAAILEEGRRPDPAVDPRGLAGIGRARN